MAHAVIQTGGKQYLVTDGELVRVDKVATDEGKKVTIKEVLLTNDGKTTAVGTPTVKGASVEATIVRHGRYPKVFGAKVKAKKRRKKYFGHRQDFTELKITKINPS